MKIFEMLGLASLAAQYAVGQDEQGNYKLYRQLRGSEERQAVGWFDSPEQAHEFRIWLAVVVGRGRQ